MTDVAQALEFEQYLEVGKDGIRRLRRDIYTDPMLFELEMKYIWERSWVYLGHESQLPKPGSFLTATIGRQPVIVVRGRDGVIRVFINACRHRGATLCREMKGEKKSFTCSYHEWTYNLEGELRGVKNQRLGAYGDGFAKSDYSLTAVRGESYRGFIFGNLDAGTVPLREYLGDAATFIDIFVDQADNGMEILRGTSTYTYPGNWKLQVENGVDGYHATTVHWNFSETQRRRAVIEAEHGGPAKVSMNVIESQAKIEGGYYDFGRGNTMIWGDWSNPDARFNAPLREEYQARMGKPRTDWALGRLRNLMLYPSVFVMDQMSSQIRLLRPVAVDRTEVVTYVIGPVGEDREQRRLRLRFYEDFLNASGMATPDDLAEFRACQAGYQGVASAWSDMTRGVAHELAGPDAKADELGISPVSSGAWIDDEGIFIAQYRHWATMMRGALTGGASA
jgi:benzoate/toluate 1,2-dioxygenase subunit alpha